MDDMPKAAATPGFDLARWEEKLLALNPWARGLTINEDNAEFAAARQAATLARHVEGKDVWNAWAKGMLALKAVLEPAGQWAAKRDRSWAPLTGENEITRVWLALVSATFSTKAAPHRFEADVSFDRFVFPGVTRFECATFNGVVGFKYATFSDAARFGDVTFSDEARFDGVTFSAQARFVGAVFSGRAVLKNARFEVTANFAQTKFKEPATFEKSIFQQSASFEDIESAAAFSLADATFHQVPSFFGATFKGALRLDNVVTPRYRWTFGYTPEKDTSARFRELRRRAVEAQDRDRELEFFAQEIRTRRFHAKDLPSWGRMMLMLPSWVPLRPPSWVPKVWSLPFWFGLGFGVLSNFGRSLWRPFVALVALWALFAAFYLGQHDDMRTARAAIEAAGKWGTLGAYAVTTAHAWNNPPDCSIKGREPFASTDALIEARLLSLKNALVVNVGGTDSARRTFGCLFGLEQDDQLRVSARVATASTLQALASGLLIFLFLLAVRNLLRLR